jgi:hypothetical protein
MRLPTASGKTCALPPVAGTTISQHLGQNSGPAVSTPPSVTPPSTPAIAIKPAVLTASKPFMPTKATSFAQKNTRTSKGATIVDLDYNGQIVGSMAQLPSGKWTVRDANGQGVGKQFGTSWMARKAFSDYLNSKQGVLTAPMPAPTTLTSVSAPPPPPPPVIAFPTQPLTVISPPPKPAPVALPKPAPVAAGAHPVPTFGARGLDAALGTTARTKIPPDFGIMVPQTIGWNAQQNFTWKQVSQKMTGIPTEWDVTMKPRWGEAESTMTLASFVRIEGGFNVKVNPEFIAYYNKNILPLLQDRYGGAQPLPDDIQFTSNNASRAMTSAKTFFNHAMKAQFHPQDYSDNIQARLAQTAIAKAPLVSKRSFAPAGELEAGYVQGRDITRQLTPEQIREIHQLHENTGGRNQRNDSDAGIDAVLALQGWGGQLPTLTDLRTFSRSLEKGDRMWLRGDTKVAYASQYKFDPTQHTGKGIFGNGTYSASFEWGTTKKLNRSNELPTMSRIAARTANEYSNGDYNVEGPITMGRVKRARGVNVMQQGEFEALLERESTYWSRRADVAQKRQRELAELGQTRTPAQNAEFESSTLELDASRKMYNFTQDANGKGVYAAMLGIDAIVIYPGGRPSASNPSKPTWKAIYRDDPNSYLLIINRSASVIASGDMNVMAGKMPRPSKKAGGIRRAPRPASWQRLQPFSGANESVKMNLGGWLEKMAEITRTYKGDTLKINLGAHLDEWYRRYERAVVRGNKVSTITFEESMGFEELFLQGEDE